MPLTVALAAGLLSGGTADAAQATQPANGPVTTVTLVTGDRVTLDYAGKVTGLVAARGREGVGFRVEQGRGHVYVVPRDAETLIAKGQVDRRLFDVERLVSQHYDDAHRADLPLIVTYARGTSVAADTFTGLGATVRRDLPSVNGDALKARKTQAGDLWNRLTDDIASDKLGKIWLDGKVRASLDRSVAQIGAPTAWAAGYDGAGVKVAVLDTGVDATHPDLKARIDEERNFSDTADMVDRVGHGTHVASIIAGSGAGSGGKYEGVAPGARLLVGKVLGDSGSGDESGIIAGMQWAVQQGAKVVNMSLGGEDTPDTDPIEQAVNDLSASSHTLFVIAAGNDGPGQGTIGSPGTAASALTVGAVDRDDSTAEFSSRGPTAEGTLKPDITAPGVGIVAAKAAEGYLGDPAATGYVSMSGTSMATPHVAGSAAILAQQHPSWTGEQIKAALTASAKAFPGTTAYTQGTGRIDVARAITQRVTSSPASLDFGTQHYPHTDDTPVVRDVTYHNAGTEPVTLDLATEAYGSGGKPAAEGMFTVTPRQLTVPAGGDASATVTADTRSGTADGTFGGSLTATADGVTTVRTAIGVHREIESYNLTIRHVGLDGRAEGNGTTGVNGLDNFVSRVVGDCDGEVTFRLPKGTYALDGRVPIGDATSGGWALLLRPKFALTKDTTLVMDAREAKPVAITVPGKAAKPVEAILHTAVGTGDRRVISSYRLDTFRNLRVAQLGSKVPAAESFGMYQGVWTQNAVSYRLAWDRSGDLSGFTRNVKLSQLTKVRLVVGAPGRDKVMSYTAAPMTPWGFSSRFETGATLPSSTIEYVLPNGLKWIYQVSQYKVSGSGEETWEGTQTNLPRAYAAGKNYIERFNVGVFGPALPSGNFPASTYQPGALRRGDTFTAYVPLFTDGVAGHLGRTPFITAKSALYADGEQIFTADQPLSGGSYTLPAGKRTYTLSVDVSRSAAQSAVSTRVTASWSFTSAHVSGDTARKLPLTVVRFSPRLSTASTTKAGTTLTVPFAIQGAATKVSTLRNLAFAVSYDDGRTWQKTKVDGGLLKLRSPAKAGTVSLRATLTDADGNSLKQTIYRAYRTTG
ncbi:S8 family peptidase [Streptomyces sp. NPDC052721]|uniref:S8 family peptidase n=1 Tax=Streptomyces sp. NPDC052721 TaxID=3154955 RepID=UPI003426305D